MTRNQKIIVLVLGAVNFFCLCIIAPAVLLIPNFSGTGQSVLPTFTRVALVPSPISTETPSPTPKATNTLVLPPRATVTPRALESSWKFLEITTEGYGVALPPNWDKIDFDPNNLAAMLKMLNEKNPEFASALSTQSEQLVSQKVKFFAFDLSNDALSSGFVTNVNIIRNSTPGDISLDAFAEQSLQDLQKTSGVSKTLTHKRVNLPAGAAELIQYQLTLTTSKGKITTSTTQYLMSHKNSLYIVTFTTRPDNEKTYASIFQKIAQSMQWLP